MWIDFMFTQRFFFSFLLSSYKNLISIEFNGKIIFIEVLWIGSCEISRYKSNIGNILVWIRWIQRMGVEVNGDDDFYHLTWNYVDMLWIYFAPSALCQRWRLKKLQFRLQILTWFSFSVFFVMIEIYSIHVVKVMEVFGNSWRWDGKC